MKSKTSKAKGAAERTKRSAGSQQRVVRQRPSKPDDAAIRTKHYKSGGWTAWHPDHTNRWGAGVTEAAAIEDCKKQLAAV